MSDRQAYFGDRLYLRYWRITHSVYDYIARFCLGPRAAQEAQCSVTFGAEFDLKSFLITSRLHSYSNLVTDGVIHLFTEGRVRVRTFIPHTTQIFQVSDMTLFGIIKRRPGYQLLFEDENESVKIIMKVYLTISSKQWWILTYEELSKQLVLGLSLPRMRKELWSIGFPTDHLSSWRHNPRFSRINKPE
jgi:hypothetical protein